MAKAEAAQEYIRRYTWGRALRADVEDQPGGLKAAHARIVAEAGDIYGTRNTFAALFDKTAPPSTATSTERKNRQRAWLLITAIGKYPAEWGLNESGPPALGG